MDYLPLDIVINAWQGRTYELIARCGEASARQTAPFPLSPAGLHARLPALRWVLARVDLGAGRSSGEDERIVEEFSALLYRFLFSGEIKRLFDEACARAMQDWQGLRLRVQVNAPDLQAVPWEVLWNILAFDLHSLKRGMFDLRIERPAVEAAAPPPTPRRPPVTLRPRAAGDQHRLAVEMLLQADAAFYAADFTHAMELYRQALHFEPGLRQAQEFLARADACLQHSRPLTTVPPRAAAGFQKAWETYTMYRFDEALRWLNEAQLQAKDWGIAEWPEAADLQAQAERSRTGFANYLAALERAAQGDLQGALEAIEQAYRADPLEVYRKQFEAWGRVFHLN